MARATGESGESGGRGANVGAVETSRAYPLARGGPERIELRWGPSFRNVRVLFDGAEVTAIVRKKIPRAGQNVKLPDGSVLSIRLRGVLGIELLRDGEHLPGSDLEPRRVLKNAALLMVIAGIADVGIDWALTRRAIATMGGDAGLASAPRAMTMALALDAGLLLLALPTALGSRVALGIGVAAFAGRFGVGGMGERSVWTLVYGVSTTWLLATHFSATFRRRG